MCAGADSGGSGAADDLCGLCRHLLPTQAGQQGGHQRAGPLVTSGHSSNHILVFFYFVIFLYLYPAVPFLSPFPVSPFELSSAVWLQLQFYIQCGGFESVCRNHHPDPNFFPSWCRVPFFKEIVTALMLQFQAMYRTVHFEKFVYEL